MCKRGFILAETIITAVFVMTLFTFFFASIFPLKGEYDRRKNYDDIDTLYAANYARDFILEYWPDNMYPSNPKDELSSTDVREITCSNSLDQAKCNDLMTAFGITKIYLTPFSIENENDIIGSTLSRSFTEYIKYMPSFTNDYQQVIYSEDYRVIIEREKNGELYYANTEILKEVVFPDLDTSGANAPELIGDMIPVVYDGINWIKADLGTWYNYDIGQWANAVTVTQASRQDYVDAQAGTPISMSDINGMFVWIPRYSYTIKGDYGYQGYGGNTPSQATPGAIDIMFHSTDLTHLITAGTPTYDTFLPEYWHTPAAFCWGNSCDDPTTRSNDENEELPGIWVAKFETGTNGTATSNIVQQPVVRPNATSWRNVNVSTAVSTVRRYMNNFDSDKLGERIYGLSGSEFDTHVMKNTEWGAVAYLSQSKYGKYGNENYAGIYKEVLSNNCSSYKTGVSSAVLNATVTSATCLSNTYDTLAGQSASTTGNIYGVYDMSGGAHDYVMGFVKNVPNNSNLSSIEKKYYNEYEINEENKIEPILGDAMSETQNFYNDYFSLIPEHNFGWIQRGEGHISSGTADTRTSGVFYSFYFQGTNEITKGFRITITP